MSVNVKVTSVVKKSENFLVFASGDARIIKGRSQSVNNINGELSVSNIKKGAVGSLAFINGSAYSASKNLQLISRGDLNWR
jgi:hypothetical protein